MLAILGALLSVFAAGSKGSGNGAATGGGTGAGTSAGVASSAAESICATFDQATGRLAAKDNKGFIDDMTSAAMAAQTAQTAAPNDAQVQALVSGFAAFATDLAANDAQKIFDDLNAINQVCNTVRGPSSLNLNGQP